MSTSPQTEQTKWHAGSAFIGYPQIYYPQYFVPHPPSTSFDPHSTTFATDQPYPAVPAPYKVYSGHYEPRYSYPSYGAYTYSAQPVTSLSPVSSRSVSPAASVPRPSTPVSIRSVTSLATPPMPSALTPAQFIGQLQQIRLQNPPPGAVLGRFHLMGEGLPVSVSQPREGGPFVIQHYLPDGRADVISIAHVFEFEGQGAERGVIVWCPPPKVQYFGMNS